MIRRLYVDNFRTLVDFTWEPGTETLVLGYNGSGKTTAIDAIDTIRSWAWGWERLKALINAKNLTRWTKKKVARLELDLKGEGGLFRSRVKFACGRKRGAAPSFRSKAPRLKKRTALVQNGSAVTAHDGKR